MDLKIDVNVAPLKGFFLYAADSQFASLLLLFCFFWIVAASSFSGFVGKWGLLEETKSTGIEVMLNSTALKPFLYRQLAPLLSNFLDQYTPEEVKHFVTWRIKPEKTFVRAKPASNPELRFRYTCIYYLSFFSLFISLFILRRILLDLGVGNLSAIIAPASFLLALPYLQTVGGYFYDSVELLFARVCGHIFS